MGELSSRPPRVVTFLQHHIASERWDRFSFYSKRIRHLEVTEQAPEIHQQTFATLSIARPFLHLLPNLTHLSWAKDPSRPAASLVLCLLFLTPTLESLSVETGQHGAEEGDLFAIDNFFKDVMHRSPRIEILEFRSQISFRNIGPSLSGLLAGLPNLRIVLLSDHLLTSDVITALAKCPHLKSIRTSKSEEETDDLQNFMPVMEPGSFPCLKEMNLKAHLWNVVSFLQSDFPAARLRRLVVHTVIIESHDNIASFFDLIAQECPEIEVLALSMPHDEVPETTLSLPFTHLEPLLGCTSITSFSLTTSTPLDMSNFDVTRIATAWPLLQELSLNSRPMRIQPEGDHITFAVLRTFAEHCPLLRVLELYIESYYIPPPEERKLLPKLEKLVLGLVGSSYVPEDLAALITDITPPKCEVGGMSYIFVEGQLYAQAHENIAQRKLDKAYTLIPTLRTIHAQYRDRLRVLETEVERLQALVVSAELS
ncbi:hypothetical protein H0H87_007783 [Tephrocybe sp. NHM501043]|nr:hypothetical protein H0H87_007783 [Tephrocybe sp. NHM501043]